MYNVPEDWKPVYNHYKVSPDFPNDLESYWSEVLGWLTPDGFVSPDKLPEEYKVKQVDATMQEAMRAYHQSATKNRKVLVDRAFLEEVIDALRKMRDITWERLDGFVDKLEAMKEGI